MTTADDASAQIGRPARQRPGGHKQKRTKSLAWVKAVADRAEGKYTDPDEAILDREAREAGIIARADAIRAKREKSGTKTEEIASTLPDLSPRQLAYVEGVVQGLTFTEAYERAYGSIKNKRTLWTKASRLHTTKTVQEWLTAYRMAGLERIEASVERHVSELTRLREQALSMGQSAAAVQAEMARGKVMGLYEERVRITSRAGDLELLTALEVTLGRDIAAQVAAALGLEAPKQIEAQAIEMAEEIKATDG